MTADTVVGSSRLHALVDEIVTLEQQKATVDAAIEKAMARLGDLTDDAIRALPADRRAAQIPLRDVSARIAARLRVSDRTIQGRLLDAQTLMAEYPLLVESWAQARITRGHVRAIVDAGERLRDPEIRADYERHLVRVAEEESVARTRPVAQLTAERLNPVPLAERHAEARKRRKMQLRPLPDAMVRVLLDVPAVLGHGVFQRATELSRLDRAAPPRPASERLGLGSAPTPEPGPSRHTLQLVTAIARRPSGFEIAVTLHLRALVAVAGVSGMDFVRDAGAPALAEDTRTLDQRRADIACELLLAAVPAGVDPETALNITASVRLTVPVLTLTGDDTRPGRAPAELAGRVPIDPATARRLVARAPGWDRVLTHPITGMVLAVDRYRPTTAQRRYLDARDMQCRFFGCTAPAHRCDHDHTIEYSRGGPTDVRYLADECKRHHPLRHHSRWQVIPHADGVFEWIDPDGRRYLDRPAPTVGFLPDSFFEARHRRDGLYLHDSGDPPPF